MITDNEYLNVLDSPRNMTDDAFICDTSSDEFWKFRNDSAELYDEIDICCDWIERFSFNPSAKQFYKLVQTQTYNSYYLKHLVEKWSGKYIPNDVFIAAVKYLEIPFRPIYGTPDISVTIFLKREVALL